MAIGYKLNGKTGRLDSFPALVITAPMELVESNELLKGLAEKAARYGSLIETNNGIAEYYIGHKYIDIQTISALISIDGVKAIDVPIVIKMTTAQYAGEVPEGLSNRLDENGAVRTWADWHDDTHNHMEANDGDMIVMGNSFGEELTSNELLVLLGEGYTIMMIHEVAEFLEE